ncbi:hypothetical protein BU24DRAFT_421418 [Aaosphaeria arxii CBS 175.79]|uniref:Uncharacterized protein n=1 Tax=Aaosphaeria arxii CBS 175.79 TaxID=1450172 RepID=A0A6A5XYN2_9PLEO|nr:uncharacterized protein BU24DRAFT_421418 [Aaosphaeria arxii CBS 175.79]KAF2018425.1 hypothetical protein BU24DRAFT_421418 [Aaosphaeria arxii CBS 175.79]
MASPSAHILDKSNYSKHNLVTLPPEPLPQLPPSSIRIQSKILGLTTNNFSYARIGHILGWWDTYPLPPNTPAPFNDSEKYGRISAWGYAEILESTVSSIPVGHTVYGFLPISDLPEDLAIEDAGYKNQLVVTSPHRQHLWKVYNRYQLTPPLSELEASPGLEFLAWDALMQGLFATSYNLNKYGFAWDEKNLCHPTGLPTTNDDADDTLDSWKNKDADLSGASVIVLSASGKTAMAFAQQVKNNRPKEHQPRAVIGVGSEASRSLSEGSGFYDKTVLYGDFDAVKTEIESAGPHRTVVIDFGGRPGALEAWDSAFAGLSETHPYTFVRVGGEVTPQVPKTATVRSTPSTKSVQVNANVLREKGIGLGGDEYFSEFYEEFNKFKSNGGIPGSHIKWGSGMKGWEEGWDALCKDKVSADTALVFKLE